MNPDTLKAFRTLQAHGGYIVGEHAKSCLAIARLAVRAKNLGCTFDWEPEDYPWDADCPAPKILLCGVARDSSGHVVASLGMVGVNDWRDPYLKACELEIMADAGAEITRREQAAFFQDPEGI